MIGSWSFDFNSQQCFSRLESAFIFIFFAFFFLRFALFAVITWVIIFILSQFECFV